MLASAREALRTDQALGQYADSVSPWAGQESVCGGESLPLIALVSASRGRLHGERFLSSTPRHVTSSAAAAEVMHRLLEVEVVEKEEISSVEDSNVILLSQVSPIKSMKAGRKHNDVTEPFMGERKGGNAQFHCLL